ncbi:uncharacterized protein C9orf40 homolog [Catharus ustulatus]|uniref:uncharacterized protein C9orf40 homolog n=1 Tax=Catharus ustulatus TaxID=91951 RepID=UPI001C5AC88F|nr:uncharacterized protein C9orf40 homolog [Catharus ustulatus]
MSRVLGSILRGGLRVWLWGRFPPAPPVRQCGGQPRPSASAAPLMRASVHACAQAGRAHGASGAAGARPLMAKRHAEPLMCHVLVKRPLREPALPRAGERRPRAEPGCAGPAAPKRPLEEAEAPPGKRLGPGASRAQPGDAGGGRLRRSGTAVPQDAPAAEGRAGRRGKETGAEEEEEFCQYNSFLYWRAPLPAIDLSDIQNLDEETPSGTKTAAKTDTTETEMET